MLLSLSQAAERLGRAPETLRTQIKRGHLAATKLGRDWLIEESEIDRYRAESAERGPGRPSRGMSNSPKPLGDLLKSPARPGDSAEQREAESWLVDQLQAELQIEFRRNCCPPVAAVAAVELDGLALGDRPALCEAWAHLGRPRPAQKNKVLADALKLIWVERECFPDGADKFLLFGDHDAARHFLEGSWASGALNRLGLKVKVYPFDEARRQVVEVAQERQGRDFAGRQIISTFEHGESAAPDE